ncbi:COX15-like protein [Tribonema minus]|uniref:COX15-like protein n=1 Tax=Tribonema minus TaxID=303371 RepID=A0A835YUA1_9STRA|nr:COX15-like protein [Tribonema minus]
MVTVGGVTRLTRSGLSMTDWKLQGSLPPLNEAEWEAEFARYKQFPEYQQRQHQGMTLDDFKYIFWWEYGHRMLGRALGVVYGAPLLYFAARGALPRHIRGRAAALLALGAAQGLVGWWMVKSGLHEGTLARLRGAGGGEGEGGERVQIRVSPYRLAAHLGMAFTTFALLVHTGLDALHGPGAARQVRTCVDVLSLPLARVLRGAALTTAALSFVTALSGAFVAGNDAGRAYNTFPRMLPDRWLPVEILEMEPLWRNFFENTATVQAVHRALAMTALGAAVGTFVIARRGQMGALWVALPAGARSAQSFVTAVALGQVTLGVSTLLLCVPLPLAAAHQAGALALLGGGVWSAHALRFAAARVARGAIR